jgi:hypothetical protein
MKGDLFGPTIDGDDVERALLAHLRRWMPTYLADAVRGKDPDGKRWPGGIGDPVALGGESAVLPVREFRTRHAAAEKWPEDALPMLLAHSPGFGKPPTRESNGTLTTYHLVHLSAIASGGDTDDTKVLARLYASAAAKAIEQKPDLGGFAEETDWLDLKNMRPPGAEMERNIMSVVNTFLIYVPESFDLTAGPDAPLEELDDPEEPESPGESPGERPRVKEGGGSAEIRPGKAAVDRLAGGGSFFDAPEIG